MEAADEERLPHVRRRPFRRRLAVAAILLALLLLGLWLARVPIATRYIDRTLGARKVPARYAITELGFGRQRLTNVVVGDPRSPDLVADWIETYTDIDPGGARLSGIRAGKLRMRARLVEGRISLGAIDQLLPAPSGGPFALPALELSVDDARVRLETPLGPVGLRIAGRGRLDDGFRGTVAAISNGVAIGDCRLLRPSALLGVAVNNFTPQLSGPVRLAGLRCGQATVAAPEARVDVTLGPALDRWQGSAGLRAGKMTAANASLGALTGQIEFRGNASRTEGEAQVRGERFSAAGVSGAMLAYAGTWRVAAGRALAAGRVDAGDVSVSASRRAEFASLADSTAGTPVGPIAAAAARAAARAAQRFGLGGEVAIGTASGQPLATVRQLVLRAASGASIQFGDGEGLVLGAPEGVRADGVLSMGGGGLPEARLTLAQAAPGETVTGTASLAPYAAGGARLALAGARFTLAPNGALRLSTVADVSGPLGDGAVEGLRLPIVARRSAGGDLRVIETCAPASFRRLAVAGLTLRETGLRLCPLDGALLRIDGGKIGGGLVIAAPRLTGALGGSPVTLAAARAEWRHGSARFVLDDVKARLGQGDRVTRLDLARLDGGISGGGISGRFAGGAGQIGAVPLLLSEAAGEWRFARANLALNGALTVADAAASARFRQLMARNVTLRLANGTISAEGALFEPGKSVKVADVTLRHVLASGTGAAHLAVSGITFGDGFQPEELTPLTFGVIADVRGTVRGSGDIAWTPEGVTSTGRFATDRADLAAAFGPVAGLKGEVVFTDLLGLESAPNQMATVASINPGVEVTDGRIDYQLLPGLRIKVNDGRWPFAGGTLTLRPTLLDFGAQQQRRLTFHVEGAEARQFLQQFDFKNLDATGVFDGELPMVFDQTGGRIENGTLTVREGGGSLAYLGELTKEDLGTWGNIAFQALRSLRYRNLDVVMNGPLAGEMITEVRFAGVSQGEGAKSNFLIRRLQRLPFVFNIRIKAPFRGLIDSAASFYDPKRLIERNLPALLEEQNKRTNPPAVPSSAATPAIQSSASENMP